MEAPVIACEAFALSEFALGDLTEPVKAITAEDRKAALRAAGFTLLADTVDPREHVETVSRHFTVLPEEDYQILRRHFTQYLLPDQLSNEHLLPGGLGEKHEPPKRALAILTAAREAKYFKDVAILRHPETGECLAIGNVKVGTSTVRFYMTQWWDTSKQKARTTVQKLRRRYLPRRLFIDPIKRLKPRDCVTLTLALSGLLLLTVGRVNWLLFAVPVLIATVLCKKYVNARSLRDSTARFAAGWMVAINVLLLLGSGFYALAIEDRTETITACAIHMADGSGYIAHSDNQDPARRYDSEYDDNYGSTDDFFSYGENSLDSQPWVIDTSDGNSHTLDGLVYEGQFYPAGDEVLPRLLLGKKLTITEHGYGFAFMDGPFVNGVTAASQGSCG